MNWQPLNLEDLLRFQEMGGNMDAVTDADGEVKEEEEGAAIDQDGETKHNRYANASEDASGPEITAKAFAYSRSEV